LVGRVKKWKPGALLSLALDDEHKDILQVALVERLSDGFAIRFTWNNPEKCFADVLDQAGFLPLPPYLKREAELDDKQRYQTVYAIDKGSVAAPTAGLHFTDNVLKQLEEKKINTAFLTLHVGAGTFKPVKADRMEDHEMHAEEVIASLEIIEQIAHCKGRIVAVGTTSMRSLESLYWTAVRLMKSESKDLTIRVDQWEPYSYDSEVLPSRKEAFGFLETHLKEKSVSHISGETQIIIAPGYSVKVVDALVTNFHQPHSTLLLLVSACIGEQWRDVYTHALAHDYRFLSYGDSSLLFLK
jgi:S-adenosylmethionine:tRNA ribosyltransferase-isomerase